MNQHTPRKSHFPTWLLLPLCLLSQAWSQAAPAEPSVRELRDEVRELRAAVEAMRTENARYREETQQMHRELEAVRHADAARATEETPSRMYETASAAPPEISPSVSVRNEAQDAQAAPSKAARDDDHIAKLDEEYDLLSSKVDEHYQSKVESASKYRVRLSGIVLLNLFSNKGQVENQDFPTVPLAVPPGTPSGSFGATLRQSQLGLEIFGPTVAGARTRADLQMDFAGGFQNYWNGVDAGIIRLRTATMHLDWAKTSIIAGQDGLFFSPTTPTSFASLAVPALAYAGNLWNWTPQVRVEHRFTLSEDSGLLLQAGILDNLNGDFPTDSNFRSPQASELSRQPAYASRAAWSHTLFGQKLTLGGAGYYGRQAYGFNRNVNAWAGMADWSVPLGRKLSLTGKFYRGSAIGGIGATIGTSTVYVGDLSQPATAVIPLNSIGGWSQLKFRATSKIEFNTAFGQDSAFARDIRAGNPQAYFDSVVRNRGVLANIIARPRSDLLFSAEYRHLAADALFNNNHTANQVNLVMGVLF
jgi:hypothetical protein